LSRDKVGLKRRFRSLIFGNGLTSLILSIKYSTSDSVNSFIACSLFFLLTFFFLISKMIIEYAYLKLMTIVIYNIMMSDFWQSISMCYKWEIIICYT
jgi:hypothetical protein